MVDDDAGMRYDVSAKRVRGTSVMSAHVSPSPHKGPVSGHHTTTISPGARSPEPGDSGSLNGDEDVPEVEK
jgi:hypothetical protein